MRDLATWLLEQIARDEAAARAATPGVWKLWGMSVMADQDGTSNVDTAVAVANTAMRVNGKPRTFDATHIARWDPARVLAECAAKKAIVELHQPYRDHIVGAVCEDDEWPCETLRLLAQPYADRPGFQTEWAL